MSAIITAYAAFSDATPSAVRNIDHGIGALHISLRHHAHNVCASIVSGLRHGVHQA